MWVCQVCKKERSLNGHGKISRPRIDPMGVYLRRVDESLVTGICLYCAEHRRVTIKLDELVAEFEPANKYNGYLFELYIRYIKRNQLLYCHAKQAKTLSGILSSTIVRPIQTWEQILSLSNRYKLYNTKIKSNGCAFIKVGYLLQELGVLGLRREEKGWKNNRRIDDCPLDIKDYISSYVARLRKLGLTESSIEQCLIFLIKYVIWLKTVYPEVSVFIATQAKLHEYSNYLQNSSCSPKSLRSGLMEIRRFYSWLIYNKKVKVNPLENFQHGCVENKITICSDKQIGALMSYVSDVESDAEGALLICLILFYGLTSREMLTAEVYLEDEHFVIILDQPKRSKGRQYYNRDRILTLPNSPPWLASLQVRFHQVWKKRYEASKKTFPTPRLLLPKHHRFIRPLHTNTLIQRISEATISATGKAILPRVLRQTCGHLNSKNGDGSRLSRLGWSPSFSFAYTWLPRKIEANPQSDNQL